MITHKCANANSTEYVKSSHFSRSTNGRAPTLEQAEIKKQELIDSLPKTNNEKREYLSQNYSEEPPPDFE